MSRLFLKSIILFLLCSTVNNTQAQSASELYEQAKALYYDGQYKEAEQLFINALELFEKQLGRKHKETLGPITRLGLTYSRLRDNEKALLYLQEAYAITNELYGSDSTESAYCLIDIGHVYAQMYEPDKANDAYNKALTIIEKTHGKESSKTANLLMNIGSAYHKKADYLDAERYYLMAYEIFRKVSKPDSKDFNRIYSNMGYMYRKKGDLEKALDYSLKALDIKLKNYEASHPSVGKYYRNIGRVYEEMNRMEEALPYMQKAVDITESALGINHPQTAGSFNELAHIYAGMHQYDKALQLYQKGNRLLERQLPADHPYVVAGYFNIALVYCETERFDEAMDYYRQAISRLLSRSYRPGNLIAQTRNDMASVFAQQNALDSALIYCQLALEEIAVDFRFQNDDLYNNPSVDDVQDQIQFLSVLDNKAFILEKRANQSDDKDINLIESLRTVALAIKLIEKMRRGYQSESSRQYLSSGTSGIYKTGVRVAMKLAQLTGDQKYLWQAFVLSEKGKASILWRSLNEDLALGAAGIPKQEQKNITLLENQIASIEKALAQFDTNEDTDDSALLRSELFDKKLEYNRHITALEQKYPEFYQLRYAPPTVDQQELIIRLSNSNMGLLNYFYDEDSLFIFLLSKDGVKGYVQPFTIDLATTIKNIREFDLSTLLGARSEAVHQAYLQQLQDLYSLLIKPVRQDLQHVSKLVVVPHGIINYLPFEMLIEAVNGSDFRDQPYLLYDFTIQYAWSAALWAKDMPYTPEAKQKYTGFAPSFNLAKPVNEKMDTSRSSLFNLTFSTQEVSAAQRLFGGRIFIDSSATTEAFRQYAPTSRILHLATHAIVDNERSLHSALAFSEEHDAQDNAFLYAHEIYNLKLSAEMAVMSACNTAFGELAEGEGIMSLGRAFFHAGCRSVIMSQWPANDRTTYRLIDNFYQQLAQGQHKDDALQSAKLTHLANADALTAHPYFWAGMIAVGDMRPLPLDTNNNALLWVVFLILLVAGLVVLILKYKPGLFNRNS